MDYEFQVGDIRVRACSEKSVGGVVVLFYEAGGGSLEAELAPLVAEIVCLALIFACPLGRLLVNGHPAYWVSSHIDSFYILIGGFQMFRMGAGLFYCLFSMFDRFIWEYSKPISFS
jgi:hypothetical protein